MATGAALLGPASAIREIMLSAFKAHAATSEEAHSFGFDRPQQTELAVRRSNGIGPPRARAPAGAYRLWVPVARAARRRSSVILAYHGVERVAAADDPELLCIDPERFRAHLGLLLDAGYEFVTVREFVERSGAPGLISISFDDGLTNLRSVALPILREHGIPATVYVTTGLLGEAYPWALPNSGLRIMDADDLRELAAAGLELGAHSISHRDLSRCSYEECMREMVGSREALEEITGAAVSTFAYPYGRYSQVAERAAADAGFLAAVSLSMLADGSSRFALSRELVTPQHGPASIALKVLGLYGRATESGPGSVLRLVSRPLRVRPKPPLHPRV